MMTSNAFVVPSAPARCSSRRGPAEAQCHEAALAALVAAVLVGLLLETEPLIQPLGRLARSQLCTARLVSPWSSSLALRPTGAASCRRPCRGASALTSFIDVRTRTSPMSCGRPCRGRSSTRSQDLVRGHVDRDGVERSMLRRLLLALRAPFIEAACDLEARGRTSSSQGTRVRCRSSRTLRESRPRRGRLTRYRCGGVRVYDRWVTVMTSV